MRDLGIQCADGSLVGAAFDRGARPDDADVTVARGGGGGLRTGSDHAGDAHGHAFLQHRKRESGSGVASDDDALRFAFQKEGGDFQAVTLNRDRAFAAVGNAGGVA